jgi:hypothetical protein
VRIWRSTRLRVSGLGVGLLAVLLLANPHDAAAAAQPCERACLEGFVDQYLEAMLAHDHQRSNTAAAYPRAPLRSHRSGEGMSTEGRDASK